MIKHKNKSFVRFVFKESHLLFAQLHSMDRDTMICNSNKNDSPTRS